MRALFTSHQLIGDGLYVSLALREWIKQHPDCNVWLSTLPDHVAPLYEGMVRDLRQTVLNNFYTVFSRPAGTFDFEHVFDVNKAFALSDKEKQHLARSYADLLGVKLSAGNEALQPVYIPDPKPLDDRRVLAKVPVILVSMFSASCESHDKNKPGLPPNKCVPFAKWLPMLRLLKKEYPGTSIRFLGAPTDILPDGFEQFGRAMFGIPLNEVAWIMKAAKLLVTIDNGMSHLGASQETPTFLMYPRCLAPFYILPVGNPNLEWVHMDPQYVSPAQLEYRLGQAIQRFKKGE